MSACDARPLPYLELAHNEPFHPGGEPVDSSVAVVVRESREY